MQPSMSSDTKSRQEDLMSYFERSATTVRSSFNRFEHTYVRPKMLHLRDAFHRRPIRVTFLSTFAALAFLPALSFLGFSLFVLASFTFFALGCALVASTLAILSFASILVFTLFALFGISIFITSFIISAFLFTRFVLRIRSDGPRSGILEWGKETKSRLYGSTSTSGSTPSPHAHFDPDAIAPESTNDPQVKQEPEDDDASGGITMRTRKPVKSTGAKHKRHHTTAPAEDQYPLSNASIQEKHIKGPHGTPGLSSGSSSPSSGSSSESEHEGTNSTMESTVVVEGVGSNALGPAGLGITGGGELKGESLVEDSPIIVKTVGEYPDKFE